VAAGDAESLLANIGITQGISPGESGQYRQLLAAVHDVAEHILQLPDYVAPTDTVRYPREHIRRPAEKEQDFGHAWAHRFLIRGDASGRLLCGKTVCVKDNIAVAGVPQFFGTDAIPAWTPEADATVVTRALDAGADIVGTAVCENFCNSTSSFTVRRPASESRLVAEENLERSGYGSESLRARLFGGRQHFRGRGAGGRRRRRRRDRC
jgi:amidase